MSIRPRKKSNSFTHKRTFLSALAVINKKFYCQSCVTNLGFKYHPNFKRHSDKRLVKISDRNTQGVRHSKSQAESEQSRFSDNKTSWIFIPVYPFCDSFMDVSPYLGANNIWKNLHWIWDKTRQISTQTDEYSPTKKIKQFQTQTNLPFSPGSYKKKINAKLVGRIWASNLSQTSIDIVTKVW